MLSRERKSERERRGEERERSYYDIFLYGIIIVVPADLFFNLVLSLSGYFLLLYLRRFSINLFHDVSHWRSALSNCHPSIAFYEEPPSRRYSNSISLHSRQLDNFCPTFFDYSAHPPK